MTAVRLPRRDGSLVGRDQDRETGPESGADVAIQAATRERRGGRRPAASKPAGAAEGPRGVGDRPAAGRRASPLTAAAERFVAARLEAAGDLGRRLAEEVNDPEAAAGTLRAGLAALADPAYRAEQVRMAPGLGPTMAVRWPLLSATLRAFRRATRRDSPDVLLWLADRLTRDESLEADWLAFSLLERTISADPERTWQLLRRAARSAADWMTVDSLAHPWARGILLEPYRWAELEQLVYSPSRWERRLVGSTIATAPFADHGRGRQPEVAARGLAVLGELIGDAEPDVQKALSWALRSLVLVDAGAVAAFCQTEAGRAQAGRDGHRAWVVRDALGKLEPATAARIRARLEGIRRVAGAPSTSRAAQAAAAFLAGLPAASDLGEPPL
ncbi:MAG: DNA alkylation repair protein [Candidatus Limnocylindrales bacterium]